MKIALITDDLLEKDEGQAFLGGLVACYPDSVLYTFSFQKKTLVKKLKAQKIISSGLTSFIRSPSHWKFFYFFHSPFAEKLKVPCSFDLCLRFSRGFSQTVGVCKGVRTWTYFFDLSRLKALPFPSYVRFLLKKQLLDLPSPLWVSSSALAEDFERLGFPSQILSLGELVRRIEKLPSESGQSVLSP